MFKNYLNCQHVISLQSRPALRIWIETFPSSPSSSKIYDISVTGQWRHRKWARDLISFLTHHSQGLQNVLTCKDLAALARQGNSWGRLVGSLITVFSPNPPAQVDWWDSFNAVIWQNEVSFSQGNWTRKGSHCSRWFPGGDQSLFSESSNFRFVISVSNRSRRSRY